MAGPKTIILTGASRGIGLATAHFLLKWGHNLVVVARTQGPLDELQKQYGKQVKVLAADLSDLSFAAKARDLALETWGQLDGLIVNHAILDPISKIANANIDEWRRLFEINYFSCFALVQACLPPLRKTQGTLIVISSGAAISSYAAWGAYGGSKAAINHLVLTLGTEEPKVTSIAFRPGVVDTGMQQAIRDQDLSSTDMDHDKVGYFTDLKASGKILKPEQPAHVIAKLVLEASKDLTGGFVNWSDDKFKDFQLPG